MDVSTGSRMGKWAALKTLGETLTDTGWEEAHAAGITV